MDLLRGSRYCLLVLYIYCIFLKSGRSNKLLSLADIDQFVPSYTVEILFGEYRLTMFA